MVVTLTVPSAGQPTAVVHQTPSERGGEGEPQRGRARGNADGRVSATATFTAAAASTSRTDSRGVLEGDGGGRMPLRASYLHPQQAGEVGGT